MQGHGSAKTHDILLGSSMLLTMGLIMAASRRTTNSKPSPETSVIYLLSPVSMMIDCDLRTQRMRPRLWI